SRAAEEEQQGQSKKALKKQQKEAEKAAKKAEKQAKLAAEQQTTDEDDFAKDRYGVSAMVQSQTKVGECLSFSLPHTELSSPVAPQCVERGTSGCKSHQ
ncbi:hypothetical protein NFI96_029434, partial [Prochilodus magdalenae]